MLRGADGTATVLTGGVVLTDGARGKVFLSEKPPEGKKIRYIRLSEGRSVCLYPESKANTVWELSRDTGTERPTQKPVELAVRAIDNSTQPGDLVLDFFAGSGSTLIRAEMTGRRANVIELDPHYCDVIIFSLGTDTTSFSYVEEVPFLFLLIFASLRYIWYNEYSEGR